MHQFIQNMSDIEPVKKGTPVSLLLDYHQLHIFRRGLGQVRWPVNRVVIRKAYAVSRISQGEKSTLTIGDLKAMHKLIKEVGEGTGPDRPGKHFVSTC